MNKSALMEKTFRKKFKVNFSVFSSMVYYCEGFFWGGGSRGNALGLAVQFESVNNRVGKG